MTEVRSPHRHLLPDTVGPKSQKPTSLRGIANTANADKPPRFRARSRCLDAERFLNGWQELQKEAPSGVDHVTAAAYAANLPGTIAAVVPRFKTKRYRPTLGRRCYMPKANGTARPRGSPALEAKVGPLAWAKRFTAIYEQDCLECSYGYRPGRGALAAVRDLTFARQSGRYGDRIEADSPGCFDHMDHPWLLDRWRQRIDDRALLRLRHKGLKAGMLATDGHGVHPETGTPQGGTLSPVLAHVYRH